MKSGTTDNSPSLIDPYGRRIEYLRLSLTDKCNLRCTYCMPVEGFEWIPKSEILRYEEIQAQSLAYMNEQRELLGLDAEEAAY